MKTARSIFLSLLLFTAIGASAGVTQTPAATAPECARNELLRFTDELARVPGMETAAADARRSIAESPVEVLVPLYATLQEVQGWDQIPAVMSNVAERTEALQTARVKRAIDQAVNGRMDNAEAERADLLLFVTMLRSFEPIAPDLRGHLDLLQNTIEMAPAGQMSEIRRIVAAQTENFQAEVRSLHDPALRTLRPVVTSHSCGHICEDDPFGICDAICNGVVSAFNATKAALESTISFLRSQVDSLTATLNSWIAQFNSLVSQVQGFVNQIAQFVTDAFNAAANMFNQLATVVSNLDSTFENLWNRISTSVTGFFNELIALVPVTPEAAFALVTQIDITNTAWVDALLARFPVLEAPCPAFGTDAGPLGIVGTLAAAQKSDGIAKLTKAFYDVAPSDVPGLKAKLAVAAIYHPAEYWNLCARSRYAIHQWDEETAHRTLQSSNLDVPLSTRGTQVSVNALRDQTAVLDSEVARAEGKVDALWPKGDELLRRLDQPLSTRVKQTSADDLHSTIRTLDRDVAKVEAKLDMLQANIRTEAMNESDFQDAVDEFETLITRLSIEDNLLLSSGNTSVSLYQLPEAFGGHLTLVGSIVQKTIAAMTAAGQTTNGAETDYGRGNALVSVGDFAGAFKEFRKAYSSAVRP